MRATAAGEELLHLVHDRIDVSCPDEMRVSGKLDVFRSRNLPRDPASLVDVDVAVVDALKDKGRDPDRRQNLTDVDLRVHFQEGNGRAGTRTAPQVQDRAPLERLVGTRRQVR